MEKGARASAQQYNQTVQYLEEQGAIPRGFFQQLREDASFEEVGVAAAQLAGYIQEDDEPERRGRPDPSSGNVGLGSHNVIFGLGGLRELKELKDLGQILRESMPEWLRDKIAEKGREAAGAAEKNGATLSEVESRLVEVGARLQAVAEQLRRGDLSDQQRAELAEQLSQLGQEQARLARRHAALREQEARPA